MDILYIYRDDKKDGLSLKYSLRSLAKYGKNVSRVFLVGDEPSWLSDEVIYIASSPVFDGDIEKSKNIANNIRVALDGSDISDDFLCSMDDHFLCSEVDFGNYPYYVKDYVARSCRHHLPDTLEKGGWYEQALLLNNALLKEKGLSNLMFTIHRNMHLSRSLFDECWNDIKRNFKTSTGVEVFLWCLNYKYTKEPFEYEIVRDVKFGNKSDLTLTQPFFSTQDYKVGDPLDKFVKGLYPDRCKYEK